MAVGIDYYINFYKMHYAFLAVQKGAGFYATNDDKCNSIGMTGMFYPGGGTMVAAMEACVGKPAKVLGKPNTLGLELITEAAGVEKSECLMIGDRLNTDVQVASNFGMDSMLIFTGCTSKE